MSLEAITKIRAVEDNMEQAKAEARAEAQKIVAHAERDGRTLIQQGREASDEFAVATMKRMNEQAAKRREEILAQAAKDCEALKAEASARMNKATQAILRRVVGS